MTLKGKPVDGWEKIAFGHSNEWLNWLLVSGIVLVLVVESPGKKKSNKTPERTSKLYTDRFHVQSGSRNPHKANEKWVYIWQMLGLLMN